MKDNCYDFVVSRDCKRFRFLSEGPKGRIEKGVEFTRVKFISNTFNLAFGDVDKYGNLDDLAISNNGDTEKVLTTVAKIVIVFTNTYPHAFVYIIGSTPSRTRRYQMGINKFLIEIGSMFYVYGKNSDGSMEPFKPGKNYIAFIVKRKKRIFEL